jgi:hypothetical protein
MENSSMGDFPVPHLQNARTPALPWEDGVLFDRQMSMSGSAEWFGNFGTHLYFKLITLGTIDLGTMLLGIGDIWKFDQPELGISDFGG